MASRNDENEKFLPTNEASSVAIQLESNDYSKLKEKLGELLQCHDSNMLSWSIADLKNEILVKVLDFLLEDWKMKDEKLSDYGLVDKNRAITELTQMNLVQHSLSLLKSNTKTIFHHTAYNILLQFVHESCKARKDLENNEPIIKFKPAFDENSLEGINEEYADFISMIITYYSDLKQQTQAGKCNKNMELFGYLQSGFFSQFESLFRQLLKEEKDKFGSYYEISFKPLARFLHFFANEEGFNSAVELIFRLFPHVGVNDLLVTTSIEQRSLRLIEDFKGCHVVLNNVYKKILDYRVGAIIISKFQEGDKANNELKVMLTR